MKSIRKYGFINARVRTMRSSLLTGPFFLALARAESLPDVFALLAGTRFQALAEQIPSKELDEIDLLLLKEEIHQIRMVCNHTEGDVATLMSLLLESYDIIKLKNLLRWWHRKRGREPEILRERIIYDFPIDAMLDAETYEDFVQFLKGTPFQTVLSPGTGFGP